MLCVCAAMRPTPISAFRLPWRTASGAPTAERKPTGWWMLSSSTSMTTVSMSAGNRLQRVAVERRLTGPRVALSLSWGPAALLIRKKAPGCFQCLHCGTFAGRAAHAPGLAILTGGPSPRRRASRVHSPNSRPMSSCAACPRALNDRPPASIGPAVKGQLGGKKGDGCGQTAFAASRWRADVVDVVPPLAAARRAHPLVAGAVVSTSLWTCRVPEMKPSRVGTLLWLRPHLESSGHPSRAAADG